MLKRLHEGEEIPDDFWNYDINIILGYRYREDKKITQQEIAKYGLNK